MGIWTAPRERIFFLCPTAQRAAGTPVFILVGQAEPGLPKVLLRKTLERRWHGGSLLLAEGQKLLVQFEHCQERLRGDLDHAQRAHLLFVPHRARRGRDPCFHFGRPGRARPPQGFALQNP